MKYDEYLNSEYWHEVSRRVKERAAYRCQLCNSQHDLQAHHRTYDHRGNELSHLDDLTCLCRRCHAIFHGKLKTPKKRKLPQPFIEQKIKKDSVSAFVDYPEIDALGYVTLTRENINAFRTVRGGLTLKTISALGIDPKRNSGWFRRLVGEKFGIATYTKAVLGAGKTLKQTK